MLKGKCALITGSTEGLGLATANALAAQGANVVLCGLGDPKRIDEARSAIEKTYGVSAAYHPANLTKSADVVALAEFAIGKFGGVDILVNNAVARHEAPIEQFPPDKWDAALAVNLSAPFHLIRLSLPGMRKRGWGRIVNISSAYGFMGFATRVDYTTTKHGIIGLTRTVAIEALGSDITCNAIAPGAVRTARADARIAQIASQNDIDTEEAAERYLRSIPGGAFATTIPQVIVFLCSPAGRDITGVTLPVDYGWTAGARPPGTL